MIQNIVVQIQCGVLKVKLDQVKTVSKRVQGNSDAFSNRDDLLLTFFENGERLDPPTEGVVSF